MKTVKRQGYVMKTTIMMQDVDSKMIRVKVLKEWPDKYVVDLYGSPYYIFKEKR